MACVADLFPQMGHKTSGLMQMSALGRECGFNSSAWEPLRSDAIIPCEMWWILQRRQTVGLLRLSQLMRRLLCIISAQRNEAAGALTPALSSSHKHTDPHGPRSCDNTDVKQRRRHIQELSGTPAFIGFQWRRYI